MIDSQVLVTSVDAGSSAAEQGVRPGWQILKIGGVDLAQVVAKLNATYAQSTLRELILRRAILSRLGGPVTLELSDTSGQHVTKTLAEGRPKGVLVQFGYLNPSTSGSNRRGSAMEISGWCASTCSWTWSTS